MRFTTRLNLPGVTGPKGQTYADPKPSPDEVSFQVDNTSQQYYQSPYYKANQHEVQPIPLPRSGVPPYIELKDFLPQTLMDAITQAGEIVFHSVGDTGAAKTGRAVGRGVHR